jgi:hypothetical protein
MRLAFVAAGDQLEEQVGSFGFDEQRDAAEF